MRPIGLLFRSVASIVVGYLLLALTNMLFVTLWFVQPIAEWPLPVILALSVPYTFLSALAAGYGAARIAARRERTHALVLAGSMGLVIIASLILDVAVEPAWYKGIYLAVMVPSTVFGGHLRARKARGAQEQAGNREASF